MCHQSEEVAGYSVPAEQQLEFAGSEGQTIPAYAYSYRAGEPQPTVIILHDIFGANTFYRDMDHGFLTFSSEGPAAQPGQQSWARAMQFLKERLG